MSSDSQEASLVECYCGARIAPQAIVQLGQRCPECDRYWERCPACFEWVAPFSGYEPFEFCSNRVCGLDGWAKSALRTGRKTLKDLRENPDVPQFEPLDEGTAADDEPLGVSA